MPCPYISFTVEVVNHLGLNGAIDILGHRPAYLFAV
jgi:hypothetical protein